VWRELGEESGRANEQSTVKVLLYLQNAHDIVRFEQVYRQKLSNSSFKNIYRAKPRKGSLIGGYLEWRRQKRKFEGNGVSGSGATDAGKDSLDVARAAAAALAAIAGDGVAFTGDGLAIKEGGKSLFIKLTAAQRETIEDNPEFVAHPRKLLKLLQRGTVNGGSFELVENDTPIGPKVDPSADTSAPNVFNTDV
jgi:hypothetical protein